MTRMTPNRLTRPTRLAMCLLVLCCLTGCIAAAPAMRRDNTAVIAGRMTAGLSPSEAMEIVLVQASKITVDHGFRYFAIMAPQAGYSGSNAPENVAIQPGADVTIRAFSGSELGRGIRGVWDAQKILTSGPPRYPVAAPGYAAPQSRGTPNAGPKNSSAPRCSIYGCEW